MYMQASGIPAGLLEVTRLLQGQATKQLVKQFGCWENSWVMVIPAGFRPGKQQKTGKNPNIADEQIVENSVDPGIE